MLSRWLQVYSTTDAAALNFLASRSQPRHVDMLHLATWLRHLSSFYSGITSKLTSQKLWLCGGPDGCFVVLENLDVFPWEAAKPWGCIAIEFGHRWRCDGLAAASSEIVLHSAWMKMLSCRYSSLSLCIQVLYQKHENIRSSWIWMEALWYLDIRLLHRSTARRRCRQEA